MGGEVACDQSHGVHDKANMTFVVADSCISDFTECVPVWPTNAFRDVLETSMTKPIAVAAPA